jgi:hypothetical protein
VRDKPSDKLEAHRIVAGHLASDRSYGMYGMFALPGPRGDRLVIMSGGGDDTGWEHVSVSKTRNPPNWDEMCFVKDLFWREDECVMQLHPPKADYVNNHRNCLHLWRPKLIDIPRPPLILVGYKELGELV